MRNVSHYFIQDSCYIATYRSPNELSFTLRPMGPIATVLNVLNGHHTLTKLIIFITTLALVIVLRLFYTRLNKVSTPKLAGPPSKIFSFFGVSKTVVHASDEATLFAEWARQYGTAYEIPSGLGTKTVVLGDLKGITHLFTHDTTTYTRLGTPSIRTIVWLYPVIYFSYAHESVFLAWGFDVGCGRRSS